MLRAALLFSCCNADTPPRTVNDVNAVCYSFAELIQS